MPNSLSLHDLSLTNMSGLRKQGSQEARIARFSGRQIRSAAHGNMQNLQAKHKKHTARVVDGLKKYMGT